MGDGLTEALRIRNKKFSSSLKVLEFILAIKPLLWGAIISMPGHKSMSWDGYKFMLSVMPEHAWGIIVLTTGVTWTVLSISDRNKSFFESEKLPARRFLALFTAGIWVIIGITLSIPSITTALPAYIMMAITNCWFFIMLGVFREG